MSRVIKFRAWDGEKMYIPHYLGLHKDFTVSVFDNGRQLEDGQNNPSCKLMQFINLKDCNEVELFEGDVVRWRRPYRTTQTHRGDNIPNGSYTEPMEPGIKEVVSVIEFHDGAFCVSGEDHGTDWIPIACVDYKWDRETIQDAIDCRGMLFDDPEEGDLQYLFELSGATTIEELIKHFSIEKIGDMYSNPELLN